MIPNFNGIDEANGLMPMEYMSPDLLKKRKEDLVLQLADAKSEAKKRVDEAQSIKEKGVQFKTLFEEGVISKRELDAAEKDASDVDSSINRAKLRVSELQTLLDGVSGRINQINNKKSVTIKVVTTKSRKKHGLASAATSSTRTSTVVSATEITAHSSSTGAATTASSRASTTAAPVAATDMHISPTNASTSTSTKMPGASTSSADPASFSNAKN
jgi:vacuolar-type H+-ATPase subunit I/STV1